MIGIDLLLGELIERMATYHQGRTVHFILERGDFNLQSRLWQWRNYGVDGYVDVYACHVDDSSARKQHLTKQVVNHVLERAAAQPILLIIGAGIVLAEGVMSLLAELDAACNVTVLYDGYETIGAEPAPLANLDTAVTFDLFRAKEGLWPAIDLIRSYCHTYEDDDHAALAETAVRLCQRYADLHLIYQNQGMAGFDKACFGDAERQAVLRGRRLHCFLSQSLTVAELWSATPLCIRAISRNDGYHTSHPQW